MTEILFLANNGVLLGDLVVIGLLVRFGGKGNRVTEVEKSPGLGDGVIPPDCRGNDVLRTGEEGYRLWR